MNTDRTSRCQPAISCSPGGWSLPNRQNSSKDTAPGAVAPPAGNEPWNAKGKRRWWRLVWWARNLGRRSQGPGRYQAYLGLMDFCWIWMGMLDFDEHV